jgi:hypothetical protein
MIYSLEPVAGALMAYAFLGERWGAWGWIGGGIILGASMLTQVAGPSEKEAAEKEAAEEAAAPAAGEVEPGQRVPAAAAARD